VLAALLITATLVGAYRLWEHHRDQFYTGERPPYLQLSGADSMLIRWQTEGSNQGQVRFGVDPRNFDRVLNEEESRIEHCLELTHLIPNTKYYYSIGDTVTSRPIFHGSEFWFLMPDLSKRNTTTRLWVLGDPGKPGKDQNAVRDAAYSWFSQNNRQDMPPVDLVLTLGDNAYTSGTNQEFQKHFFKPYQNIFRNIPVLPACGNHDNRRNVIFNLFDFPSEAQLGGHPSYTERYFSLNYQDVHLIFLDSTSQDAMKKSSMVHWLMQDLKKNDRLWTLVILHHPPYTKGSHDSDDLNDSDGRMAWIRQALVPVFEFGGVDLVLSGHSHGYERSSLINNHFGLSNSWTPDMLISEQTQMERPLLKNHGTVYLVAGSSSKIGPDSHGYNHPAMVFSSESLGSLVIDVGEDQLLSRFINQNGEIIDEFSLIHQKLDSRSLHSLKH